MSSHTPTTSSQARKVKSSSIASLPSIASRRTTRSMTKQESSLLVFRAGSTSTTSLTARASHAATISTSTPHQWKHTLLLALFYFIQTAPKGYLSMLPILLRQRSTSATSTTATSTLSLSLKTLATLSLVSLPDLFKPFVAVIFDHWTIFGGQSLLARKNVILILEVMLIGIVASFAYLASHIGLEGLGYGLGLQMLMMHFIAIHVVTMLHDTAVDGFAVLMLRTSSSVRHKDHDDEGDTEHDEATRREANKRADDSMAMAGLGQYLGYKIGGLVVSGLLPLLIDLLPLSYFFPSQTNALTNYNIVFCGGILLVMLMSLGAIVSLFQSIAISPSSLPSSSSNSLIPASDGQSSSPLEPQSSTKSSTTGRLLESSSYWKQLLTPTSLLLIPVLLGYKTAEHALDYIWTMILVDRQVDRKSIIATQMLLGGIAALIGASLGKEIVSWTSKGSSPNKANKSTSWTTTSSSLKAVAICSILRLIPEAFQVYFVSTDYQQRIPSSWNYALLSIHSIAENIFGSALTSTMFAFLLKNANPNMPATSYAIMNTLAMLGMQVGKYLTRYADGNEILGQGRRYFVFCGVCWIVNVLYSMMVTLIACKTNLLR